MNALKLEQAEAFLSFSSCKSYMYPYAVWNLDTAIIVAKL